MGDCMEQKLILPFKSNIISAAYKMSAYTQKHGYKHYGIDLGCKESDFNVYALGDGTVIDCGLNNGALNKGIGNCIIIEYLNVKCNDGKVRDLICQMFHFDKIHVKKGQKVTLTTIIGEYGNTGANHNPSPSVGRHLHLQFSVDVLHPNLATGISQSSNGVIVKKASIDNTIDPSTVWFKSTNQSIVGLTQGWFANNDINLKTVSDMELNNMANYQKLILPVNNMRVTCGYKNPAYQNLVVNGLKMGTHYGVDYAFRRDIKNLQMWASGNGTVIATGKDNCFGNFVVIRYDNVYNHVTKQVLNVVMRYFHLASVSVSKGQKVTKDTKLGIMGMTGTYATGIHCHMECDTDLTYWNYTPSLKGNSTYFRAGDRVNDTTFNPIEVLHIKNTAPDYQTFERNNDAYTSTKDVPINF